MPQPRTKNRIGWYRETPKRKLISRDCDEIRISKGILSVFSDGYDEEKVILDDIHSVTFWPKQCD